MIELRPANRKLAGRIRRVVSIAGGVDDDTAVRLIEQADGNLKAAVLMAKNGGRLDHAMAVLDRVGNNLRVALELVETENAGK
jgi:N-acetylmuramic acid 6-phosphate etherase